MEIKMRRFPSRRPPRRVVSAPVVSEPLYRPAPYPLLPDDEIQKFTENLRSAGKSPASIRMMTRWLRGELENQDLRKVLAEELAVDAAAESL